MTTAPRDEKLTLFLAEDEEGTAILLKFHLARGGYTVVHAADGQQAQTMIDQMPPPALVLLEEISFHVYPKPRHVLLLVLAAIAENFGYRQLNAVWRLIGLVKWLRGEESPVGRDVSKSVLANSLSLWVRVLGRPVFQTRQGPVFEVKRHPVLLMQALLFFQLHLLAFL